MVGDTLFNIAHAAVESQQESKETTLNKRRELFSTCPHRRKDRKRLNSTIKKAGKIMNREVPNIETLFHTACLNKYNSILKDNDHPMNCNLITSMRSNRIIQPKSRTERYRLSFIPTAVRFSIT